MKINKLKEAYDENSKPLKNACIEVLTAYFRHDRSCTGRSPALPDGVFKDLIQSGRLVL